MSAPSDGGGGAGDALVVTQFAPAWELQAYCRFARVPHAVQNARYPYFSSTGACQS